MTTAEIKSLIEKDLPGVKLKLLQDSLLAEHPADLVKIAVFLKNSLRFDYLSAVTGADYLHYLESVYHFYSMERRLGPLVVRVRADRLHPNVPSLCSVYRGAEFQEREIYDLFGIHYENHPDLRRLLLWEGFEGFPMRKDYAQEDSEILEDADIRWLERRGVQVPENLKKIAEELKSSGKRALAQRPKTGAAS